MFFQISEAPRQSTVARFSLSLSWSTSGKLEVSLSQSFRIIASCPDLRTQPGTLRGSSFPSVLGQPFYTTVP